MSNETIDFSLLDIKVPAFVSTYSIETQKEIFDYLKQLDENNKKAYLIALDHLGSSFNIFRSNGFKNWKNKNL
jgi:hypothetical protein